MLTGCFFNVYVDVWRVLIKMIFYEDVFVGYGDGKNYENIVSEFRDKYLTNLRPQNQPSTSTPVKQASEDEDKEEDIKKMNDEDNDRWICLGCKTWMRDTILLPCNHICYCHPCARKLKRKKFPCPQCQRKVNAYLPFQR